MDKCLYCYKPLKTGQTDYHPACAKKLFGTKEAPELPYVRSEIGEYALTPAYDLLSTAIVMPEDTEELALTLNGKKRRIKKADFLKAMKASGLNDKVIENIAKKFRRSIVKWLNLIEASFLTDNTKKKYKRLILSNTLALR